MRAIALAAALLLLGGCTAAVQKMTDEDKAKVKSVHVDTKVEKGQLFLLAPSAANIGMLFGAIGGAVTGATAEENQKVFLAFLDKNNISIEKIVREEMASELRASGKLAVAAPGDTSAPTIKVSIPQYGFGVPHLLSSDVVPTLYVKLDMVDSAGKVIWSSNDRLLPSIANPVPPTTWAAMAENPAKIEAEWRACAKVLAKKIVGDI